MRFLLLFALSLSLLAEEKPKLSDAQRAELYRVLAADAAAQAQSLRTAAAVKDKIAELEKYCGSAVTEAQGKMAECSEPPKKEAPKK